MTMDTENIKSDLLALQRLYCLLRNDYSGMPNSASNTMDEHARLLLKRLLDAATHGALEVHNEKVSGQVEGKPEPSPIHAHRPSDYSFKESREVDQNYGKEEDQTSDHERNSNGIDFNLWKERKFTSEGSPSTLEEQSVPIVSKPEFIKKCCRVCKRSTVRQIDTNEEMNFYDAHDRFIHKLNNQSESFLSNSSKIDGCKSEMGMQTRPFVCKMSGVGPRGFSSDAMIVPVPDIPNVCSNEETDFISKEASEAIEHIEWCISALKLGEDQLHTLQKSVAPHQNLALTGKENPFNLTSKSAHNLVDCNPNSNAMSGMMNPVSTMAQPINISLCESRNHFSRNEEAKPNGEAVMEKMESENRGMTPIRQIRYPCPAFGLPELEMENPLQNHMTIKGRSRHELFQPSETDSEDLQSVDSDRGTHGTKHPPYYIMKRTPQMSENHKHKQRVATSQYSVTAPRASLHQKIFGGSPSTSYSSYRRSQQSSSFGSESEDYSFSHQTGSHYIASNTSIRSGNSSVSHRTWSNSNSGFYSSTSNDGPQEVTSSSSNRSDGYSSYDQAIHHREKPVFSWKKPVSRKEVGDRLRKSAGDKYCKNRRGTWRRLKDRLAIIFHHHHHHHHHSNGADHYGNYSDPKKHMGRPEYSNEEEKVYGQMAVEKVSKSLIHDKHRKGNFHGLVEGFLKHIKHTKKSKPDKEAMGKLSRSQQARKKKVLRKAQWWKLLQHHRSKFPSKWQAKVGLGKNSSHLKALPKLK